MVEVIKFKALSDQATLYAYCIKYSWASSIILCFISADAVCEYYTPVYIPCFSTVSLQQAERGAHYQMLRPVHWLHWPLGIVCTGCTGAQCGPTILGVISIQCTGCTGHSAQVPLATWHSVHWPQCTMWSHYCHYLQFHPSSMNAL